MVLRVRLAVPIKGPFGTMREIEIAYDPRAAVDVGEEMIREGLGCQLDWSKP